MLDAILLGIIRRPRLTGTLGFLGAACLLGLLWYIVFWQTAQRAFTDMLANNLASSSVTKIASASSSSSAVQQIVQVQSGSMNAADWLVTARQADSSATTESIGTPDTGYIRYERIVVSKADATKHFNFSKVLGTWGKSDGKTDPSLNHLYEQSILDISSAPLPPIGNLQQVERQKLLDFMHDEQVFSPNYSAVKQQKLGGRQMYTYDVEVKLAAYVRLMQLFAHDIGYKSLDTIDPNQYNGTPPIKLQFAVDKLSHQLAAINYPSSNFAQRYTDWGVLTPIKIPRTAISTTELQTLIQRGTGS